VVMGVGVFLYMTDAFRYMKTYYLIARVAPYEQTGSGEGAIQFLGDSTGYGTGATRGKYSIAGRLGAEYPGYAITNQSVNGRTIDILLQDIAGFSGQFDLIVLQMGGNDILQKRDTDLVLADLEAVLQRLLPHTKEIVMLTSGNVGGAIAFSGAEAQEYERLTRAYRTRVIELSKNTPHFTYVDLFDEPGHDPFQEQPDTYTALDDLHPSNAGYGLWYSKAKPAFDAALNK